MRYILVGIPDEFFVDTGHPIHESTLDRVSDALNMIELDHIIVVEQTEEADPVIDYVNGILWGQKLLERPEFDLSQEMPSIIREDKRFLQ